MALLYATDVGEAAWQRMAHDGIVVPLRPGVGHASTTERTPALRAASLAAAIPRRAALAGAAALWVHGWGGDESAPRRIDIAVPRGCHPDPPPGFFTPWWQFVTDPATVAAATSIGGVPVADVGNALRSLLSGGSSREAIEGAWWALSQGRIDRAAGTACIAAGARGQGRRRALTTWSTVCAAAGAC
ncbi:MAG: hypothetical protein HGA51_04255 [Demequinaceae bacterium]|nr:hypothetical protein [Demequinaceae bacterium]